METPEPLLTMPYTEVVTHLGGGQPLLPVVTHTGEGESELITYYIPAWCPGTRLDVFRQEIADAWPRLPSLIVLVHDVPLECLGLDWRPHAPQKETTDDLRLCPRNLCHRR